MKKHFFLVVNLFFVVFIFLCAFGLLLSPQITLNATKNALNLCTTILIPSIFPFLVLSSLIVEANISEFLPKFMKHMMGATFNLNSNCFIAIFLGVIAGFPIGAKTASELYNNGLCNKTQAERLLAFCNNCGPSFVIGGIGTAIYGRLDIGIILYSSQLIAAIITGIIFGFLWNNGTKMMSKQQSKANHKNMIHSFVNAIRQSTKNMGYICAFVCFFSIVIGILNHYKVIDLVSGSLNHILPLSKGEIKQILIGFIEITNGVKGKGFTLSAVQIAITSGIIGWSGLCVHFQVLSILNGSGLSKKAYILGKITQSLVSPIVAIIIFSIYRII